MNAHVFKMTISARHFKLFRDMTFYMTQRSMETLTSLLAKAETFTQEMETLHLLAKVANQHKAFQDYMLLLLEQAEDKVNENDMMELLVPEAHYRLMVLTATMPSLDPQSQNMKVATAKTGVPLDLYSEMVAQIKLAVSNARRLDDAASKEEDAESLTNMKAPTKYIQ